MVVGPIHVVLVVENGRRACPGWFAHPNCRSSPGRWARPGRGTRPGHRVCPGRRYCLCHRACPSRQPHPIRPGCWARLANPAHRARLGRRKI